MQKLRLNLDALTVESFNTTDGDAAQRGTVQAHRPTPTQSLECESFDYCGTGATDCGCGTAASECGTCATNCGTCATGCGTCYDATCGATYCGTCDCPCTCNCC
ncbi:MAG TPA: hypothetical protein VGC13_14505 [Longimicrobium sp.]|jgi:hypothetical protein|uniref:hypothetical protein n=1 Tax=Longimicrobium sp. TaxID=2029185 RepID=UPI002EDAB735